MSGIKIISGLATLVILGSASFYIYINHHLETTYPVSPLITEPSTRKLLRGAALREHVAPDPSIAYLFLLKALEEIHATGELAEESPEVQELVQEDGDLMRLRQINLVTSLGEVFALKGDTETAKALFGSALADVKKHGGDGGWLCLDAVLMYNLAQVAERVREVEESGAWANSALAVVREHGDVRACVNCETHVVRLMGRLAEKRGELEEALGLYQKSLELARQSGTGNIEETKDAVAKIEEKIAAVE
ncbi:hypothetical protein FBU59_001340 [Linderina macrospora]|uniref:Uncharacterized protein n=1 Tax=Linderina macrospora TaxID=4868 RepID=A0ACC1JEH9_9FUNG|nr:hypothetical protein FBU59_001340 [Linderina macrospora]